MQASVLDIDYIELYVSNLFQASHFYERVLGFSVVAESQKIAHWQNFRKSILVRQNNIRLILTTALTPHCPIAKDIYMHGDGVKDIAFLTDNTEELFDQALKCGATALLEPTVYEDEYSKIIKATISTFGNTQHSLIERLQTNGGFLSEFGKVSQDIKKGISATNFISIDHFAVCLDKGSLGYWQNFYQKVFNFSESHKEEVYTENSGMNSLVVQNSLGNCIITLLEPSPGKGKSQISEFLELYGSAEVQHIAFLSDDIAHSVKVLLERGLSFRTVPDAYYEALSARINDITENIDILRELKILVDRDHNGHLFQIFSKTMQSRPTFFIEVIQRVGAKGFGSGNIKALFEAVEREQLLSMITSEV